jgi:multidrug efflux pump subunit AcrA (membrane-fusion protein)
VANLSAGQPARLTFDAYPGKIFPGELLAVSTRGKDIGGLAIFEIEASLSYQNVDLRPGMLANLRVVIGEKPDVLTIPAAAVQYRLPTQPYVNVRAENGEIREQDVQIGLNDGIMAEVQAGLSEGQTILIPLTPPMDQPRSAQTAVPTAAPAKPASGVKP